MPTLNQIKATRQHSATDRAATAKGRFLQRRIRAAMRQRHTSRLADLSQMLQYHRHGGFPDDVKWFLWDYADAIDSEVRFANWSAKR
jgi:hypothetical protein